MSDIFHPPMENQNQLKDKEEEEDKEKYEGDSETRLQLLPRDAGIWKTDSCFGFLSGLIDAFGVTVLSFLMCCEAL